MSSRTAWLSRSLTAAGIAAAVTIAATGCSTAPQQSAAPPAAAPATATAVATAPIGAQSVSLAPASPTRDGLTPFGTLPDGSRIVLLGWNDLGMHCFNEDFSALGILPPYNNLYAQVVRVGGDPQVVTKGITVEYAYPENTYSAGVAGKPDKSNFWQYAKALFGVDLPAGIGLTGRGLSGKLGQKSTYWVAEGIPVTDYRDQDVASKTIYPYQIARVTVKDNTGKPVAGLDVVTPVSTEMRCDTCHSDTGKATTMSGITPTGNVYLNVLAIHDKLEATSVAKLGAKPLIESRPVLCASCHSSNALGASGKPEVEPVSVAMHKRHATAGIPTSTAGCQNCHPGPQTKCYRDVHTGKLGYQCPTCHGGLAKVAANKNPWLNEPRCDNPACHKNTPAAQLKQSKPLYRQSIGHHGGLIMCEACHDSTHGLAQSQAANDHLKFQALQGSPVYLKKCRVCHGTDRPDGQTKAHAPAG